MTYKGFIKKSRTLDLGVLVAVFGVIQIGLPGLGLTALQFGIVDLVIGVLIVVLRSKTTGPVGAK